MITKSITERCEAYFKSGDFKNHAAWVGLALSVAALAGFMAALLVGVSIPKSDSKFAQDNPLLVRDSDLRVRGFALWYFGGAIGGALSLLAVVFSVIGIKRNTNSEERELKGKIMHRSLIIGTLALFIFGATLAGLADTFYRADSQTYYTSATFESLRGTLTALKATGITLSVFGAIGFGASVLGVTGLKAAACYIKRWCSIKEQDKIVASRKAEHAPLDDHLGETSDS